MTSQPWIRPQPLPTRYQYAARFNGAMTSQPWILWGATIGNTSRLRSLQWSHDLSAMDTRCSGVISSRRRSIQLLQWSHDLSAMDTRTLQWTPRTPPADTAFNGAMTSQPWIHRYRRRSGTHRKISFNGAMTSQPWIPMPIKFSIQGVETVPSMEP